MRERETRDTGGRKPRSGLNRVLRGMAGLAAMIVVGLVLADTPAAAGPLLCDARVDVLQKLEGDYAETPVALGLANTGAVLEVLASAGGESWTVILTTPDGTSCLVAAGEGWQTLPMVALGAKVRARGARRPAPGDRPL